MEEQDVVEKRETRRQSKEREDKSGEGDRQ